METLSTFDSRKLSTRKSLDTAPDVSAQHVNEAERMDSEGGANHTQGHNKRYDTSRRRSTGSAKADEEAFRTNMDKSQARRNSSDKLSLQTEGLETSNMSEKEIKELALERSREQPHLNSSLESGPQPIPGLSYASVVKEATPSQGPASNVSESILSRQAAKAMQLEKEQREQEKQIELEQVKIQEELLVPTSAAQQHLQHPIIPVVLELDQAKSMHIETNEMTTNFIHPALEQHVEIITVETVVDAPAKGASAKLAQGKQQASQKLEQGKQQASQKLEQGKQLVNEKVDQVKQLASEQLGQAKELVDDKTSMLQEGAESIKSNFNNALDNLSSSVSATTASPLQKARDILSSVSETVKSKLPSFGSSSEETEEVEEDEEVEEEAGPSTLEQLKTQASQLPTMVSNKVSSMLPISLKGTSTADISAKANELTSAASDKANELKGKAESMVTGAKQQLKANVPSVEQGKQQLEQGKKQLKQQLQQGKEQLAEKLPASKKQPSKNVEESKQQASKKLEQGKQMANEKVGQVKQMANEKLGQAKQLANEKLNQAKELAPEMQKKGQQLKEQATEKGQQLKGQATEMLNKKPTEKSTSSAPSSLNKLLSNITDRATDLRNQATETVTNLSNTVSEKLPTNLSASLPNLSNLTEKLPSMASLKSSATETVQQGKKKAKKQVPSDKQQTQLLAQGKKQLNNLSNQAAETFSNLKEQGLSAVQSAGLMDEGNNLHLREGIESSLRKLQGQSQFQSAQSFVSPYIAKGKTMASNYVQSYTDFLYTLKEQNYVMQLVFGLMAVMHVFIPLLFLDYPQARMTIKWFSFVAIFSHAIFYFSHSLKLVQLPNVLLYPLITYLLMLSPMMGEGLSAGTGTVFKWLPDWLSWLSVLGIPFQARSYFFTLWLRTLLMLDTAVLTWNFMQAQTFMRKHGGTISTSLKAFFQSDEGKQIKNAGKKLQLVAKPVTDMVQNVQDKIAYVVEEEESNEQEQGEDEQEMPKQSKKHQLKSKKSTTEIPAKKQRVEESEEQVEQPEEEEVEQSEEQVEEEDVPEQDEEENVEEDVEVEQDESEHSDLPEHEASESFSKIEDLTVNNLQHMPLDRYASGKGMNKKENGWDFSKENVKEHDELKWDDVQVPFSKQNEDELIAMEDGQLAK